MGRSQETFNKKDVRNKKEKKRKEKEKKRLARKENEGKTDPDDMIAYVDEFGRITSTPPDPDLKEEVDPDNIEVSVSKSAPSDASDFTRKGIVTFFNDSKGFGFIRDLENKQSVFVHINNVTEQIKENNVVSFEIGKGPKGPTALKVSLYKQQDLSPNQG